MASGSWSKRVRFGLEDGVADRDAFVDDFRFGRGAAELVSGVETSLGDGFTSSSGDRLREADSSFDPFGVADPWKGLASFFTATRAPWWARVPFILAPAVVMFGACPCKASGIRTSSSICYFCGIAGAFVAIANADVVL